MNHRCAPFPRHVSAAGWTAGFTADRLAPVHEPHLPKDISPFARACLDALAAEGLGRHISIGGAFALAHYYEYRPTHDVDAWWRDPVTREQELAVVGSMTRALERFGAVRKREWGDVVSVELEQDGKTVFSFQVARRSAQIDPPVEGVWPGGIALDSLDELVAAKMVALVERGAPRDLRDIYSLCTAGYCTVARCWQLWEVRQGLARGNADRSRARAAIMTHLARLAVARPLERIRDTAERESAAALRSWFERELLA